MEIPSKFIVDPQIDKPWGSTLREKLPWSVCLRYTNWGAKERQQAFLALLPGIGNTNPREIYLSFWTNPNFIIVYILYFLFVSMNAGKILNTKWLKSSQRPYFDKSNLTQASWWLREDPLFSGRC